MKTRTFLSAGVLLAVFATALPAAPDNRTAGPTVPMPPFHVNEFMSYFGFAWKAVIKDEKIQRVRFSRVDRDSLAGNAGLLLDDRLIAIDGHPVAGMTVDELQQVFYRDVKPGSTVLWRFTVESGWIGSKRHDVTLQLRSAPTPES